MRDSGRWNRYSYASGDPVNNNDLLGLASLSGSQRALDGILAPIEIIGGVSGCVYTGGLGCLIGFGMASQGVLNGIAAITGDDGYEQAGNAVGIATNPFAAVGFISYEIGSAVSNGAPDPAGGLLIGDLSGAAIGGIGAVTGVDLLEPVYNTGSTFSTSILVCDALCNSAPDLSTYTTVFTSGTSIVQDILDLVNLSQGSGGSGGAPSSGSIPVDPGHDDDE